MTAVRHMRHAMLPRILLRQVLLANVKYSLPYVPSVGWHSRSASLRIPFGTGVLPDEEIAEIVRKEFDLRPTAIIRTLELRKPIYRNLAAYGHFGRDDLQVKWESTEPAERLKAYVK